MDEDEVRELLYDEAGVSDDSGVRDDRNGGSVQEDEEDPIEEEEEEEAPMDDRIPLPPERPQVQRPTRTRRAPEILQPTMKGQTHGSTRQQHLHIPEEQAVEYDEDIARYATMLLQSLQDGVKFESKQPTNKSKQGKVKANLLVNYSLDQGIRKFKRRGFDAAKGEMKQLHDRDRKSTRLNSSHRHTSRMPSSA